MQVFDKLRARFGRRKAEAQTTLREMVQAAVNDHDVDEAKLGELLQAAELTFADFESAIEVAIARREANEKLRQADALDAASPAALKALADAESRLAAVRARAAEAVSTAERAVSEARAEVGRISDTSVRLRREATSTLAATENQSIENVRHQQQVA